FHRAFSDQDILSNYSKPSGAEPWLWLGTDELGRSQAVRLLYGARVSLFIGSLGALTALVLGLGMGVTAGYFRGRWDDVVVWLVTTLNSIPLLFLLLIIGVLFRLAPLPFALLLGGLGWLGIANYARGQTLALLALLLISCQATPVAATPAPGGAQTGGTLRIAIAGEVTTLDPWSADAPSLVATRQIYETLVTLDPASGTVGAGLASGWQIANDGASWTFTLRDGVRFHDGSSLDAAAVVASFDRGRAFRYRMLFDDPPAIARVQAGGAQRSEPRAPGAPRRGACIARHRPDGAALRPSGDATGDRDDDRPGRIVGDLRRSGAPRGAGRSAWNGRLRREHRRVRAARRG